MARTAIAALSGFPLAVGAQYYPATPLSATTANLTFVAADNSMGNVTPIVDGKTVVLAHNTDDMGAHTITFTSVADGQNRKGDVTTYSIASGAIASFGPFKQAYWNQSSPAGLYIDTSASTIELCVITLPTTS